VFGRCASLITVTMTTQQHIDFKKQIESIPNDIINIVN